MLPGWYDALPNLSNTTVPFTILKPEDQEVGEFDMIQKFVRRILKLQSWERVGRGDAVRQAVARFVSQSPRR